MFNNPRYLTKGVNQRISLELQIFMWNLIDNLSIEKDYLQVFNISVKNGVQVIQHKQEVSEYQNTYYLKISNPIDNTKVFVIDDDKYSTMLLAEEY